MFVEEAEHVPGAQVERGGVRTAANLAVLAGHPERFHLLGPLPRLFDSLLPDRHRRPGTVRRKVNEYLLRGTPMVLDIDLRRQTATIHRVGQPASTFAAEDALGLSDVLEGFTCIVREIFE